MSREEQAEECLKETNKKVERNTGSDFLNKMNRIRRNATRSLVKYFKRKKK